MLTYIVEMKLNGSTWTDVSDDVILPLYCSSGMVDNSPTTRVADVGRCTFSLRNGQNNTAGLLGYYSPGHANCRAGFEAGTQIRVRFNRDGNISTKWYGRIAPDGIVVDWNVHGERRTTVTAYDWMYQATMHRLYLPEYTTNKRADEVIPLIIANMPIAPANTSYSIGQDTFPFVFDTVRYNTTAMAEFQKLAVSEFGYIYLRHGGGYDETLVFEDRLYRNNVTATTIVPIAKSMLDFFVNEDGDYFVNEDGDKFLVSESRNISLDNSMIEFEYDYGGNLANRVEIVTYPRKVDTSPVILFALRSRMKLDPGESVAAYRVTYRDPDGGARKVAGKDMVSPVADTDYWMDSVRDSDSKDLTADLALSVTYGTEGAEYSLENTGATAGYVYFQARGYGIYAYDPVSKIYEDTASIAKHGTHELRIDLSYQNDPRNSELFGQIILAHLSTPIQSGRTTTYLTSSDDLAMLFTKMDIGGKIAVAEDQTAVDSDYFINGWEFTVLEEGLSPIYGNLVKYTISTKRASDDTYLFAKWDTLGGWDTEYGWDL